MVSQELSSTLKIYFSGVNDEDQLSNLEEVLKTLEEAGLRPKRSKSNFMMSSITFLGHKIDVQGLHPLPQKLTAIQEAPLPKTITELKSFLGLLGCYRKFLPNVSATLSPLYDLLKTSSKMEVVR